MKDRNEMVKLFADYEQVKYETGCGAEQAVLAPWLSVELFDERARQPFAALENTVYGKKDKYHDIVQVWKTSEQEQNPESWMLLALVNTIEGISPSIYEHYRALADLFSVLWKRYAGLHMEKDILAALAVSKACRMKVMLPEHYAMEGRSRIEEDGNTILYDAVMREQLQISQEWGM